MPAFEHDGLALYETDAIIRYVDEAFPGVDLQPADAAGRARMAQAINIIGGYAYPAMIGQIFIQRAVMPMIGSTADEEAIAAAIPQAETAVAALEKLIDGNAYLAGDRLSLADLLLIPVYDYIAQTPEGQKMLAKAPNLQRWWEHGARAAERREDQARARLIRQARDQCRKCRRPVNTIAAPARSAAAITSASRMLPPG